MDKEMIKQMRENQVGGNAVRETEAGIISGKCFELKELAQQAYTLINDRMYSYSQQVERPVASEQGKSYRSVSSPYFSGINENLIEIERALEGIIDAFRNSEL